MLNDDRAGPTEADPRRRHTEDELAGMRAAIQDSAGARPETRRERVLREAIAADVADFGAFALRLDLAAWLQACRVRVRADDERNGHPQRTPERWRELDGRAEAMYADNCTFYSRQRPAVPTARPDAGRLYRSFDDAECFG